MRIQSSLTPKDYILFGASLLLFSLYPIYPGKALDIAERKYQLLNSLFRVIKNLATGVYNKNKQSNIKFASIQTKISTKALSIFFDIARLYTLFQICAYGS